MAYIRNILSIIIIIGITSLEASAQSKTKSNNAPLSQTLFSDNKDSVSYAMGSQVARSFLKDIDDLNSDLVLKAMNDVFKKQPLKISDSIAQVLLQEYAMQEEKRQAQKVINEGEAVLAKNRSNPAIKTTSSGLQYEIIKEGDGNKPTVSDTVVCHYTGQLIDGTEFDNSYKRGEPLTIPVGAVIKGWTEGLQLMSKGAKYKFYIPYQLGYGLRGAGGAIPGGSALIFEVELLEIKGK